MQRTRSWMVGVVGMLAVMGLAASCTPPAPTAETWTFRGTQVTVNNSQDETLGICFPASLCQDEPYLINIGFRVQLGVEGSAQTQVLNSRDSAHQNVPEGGVRALTGAQQATVTWNNIKPLDILDLTNSSNKLEIVGVYSWAAEEDFVGLGVAANGTADILRDALNATIAQGDVPSDLSILLDLILDNIFGALGLLAQNIPLFGLGDDTLGGGLFLGIGAKGALADIIDDSIGSAPPLTFEIPVVSLPPDIQGGGIFTFDTSPRNFTQSYSGAGGQHTYNYQVARS